LPKPIFETDDDRSYFFTILPIHPKVKALMEEVRPESGPSQARVRPESTEDKILSYLKDGSYAKSQLATLLGHTKISGALKQGLRLLQEEKLIEYTIPDKPQSRLQKYKLTKKGQNYLKEKLNH